MKYSHFHRITTASISVLLILTSVGNAWQERNRRTAITRIDEAGEDFHLQGEYEGRLTAAMGHRFSRSKAGLQVVSLGRNEFSAVLYPGGLPGAGWYRGDKIKLRGKSENGTVRLEDKHRRVLVSGGKAEIESATGVVLGTLKKVHRTSSTLGAPAPCRATVLFDGSHTDHFRNGRMTDDGLLRVGTELNDVHRDYLLHVEFRLPYMPLARGQGRSNSGVYLQSSYEVQILDSFGLDGRFNECGALYRYREPRVNMCLPPLSWQTYDIDFRSPRFNRCGQKVCHARITVRHNGVVVHTGYLERKTGAGRQESPTLYPIKFQNHGNPVVFRNIWIVDREAPTKPRRTRLFGNHRHKPLFWRLRR